MAPLAGVSFGHVATAKSENALPASTVPGGACFNARPIACELLLTLGYTRAIRAAVMSLIVGVPI